MTKEIIKTRFSEIQKFYSGKPSGKKEIASAITFLLSHFSKSEKSKLFLIESFKNHPDIHQYIITYLNDPSCQCKAKVRSFFEENTNLSLEIFSKAIENEEDEEILKKIKGSCNGLHLNIFGTEFDLYGKIFQIENSKEEYSKILNKFNKDPRYKYKGLQVLKTEDGKLDIYFY